MPIPLQPHLAARRKVVVGRPALIVCCSVIGLVLLAAGPLLIAAFIRLTLLVAGIIGLI